MGAPTTSNVDRHDLIDDWVVVDSASAPDDAVTQPRPRIIIHGGAGNITRENLPRSAYEAYRQSLLHVLSTCQAMLSTPQAKALDIAVHAVSMLEDDPLFNAGKGAVFARNGVNELEASIMTSNGYRKRATGCMLLRRVKNPVKLAKELLVRGEKDNGGGGQGHNQLSGEELERLAKDWGLEMVDPEYFFTQRRWDEHMKGLRKEHSSTCNEKATVSSPIVSHQLDDPCWDGNTYLPQGTVGAVVLDSEGTICVATSTGGLTNKLPGRIGDTPTIGAGFWAEQWQRTSCFDHLPSADRTNCKASSASLHRSTESCKLWTSTDKWDEGLCYAVGISGTGNGDTFLRTNASRTAAALSQFSTPPVPLAGAISRIAGPGGLLEKSAGDRWGLTGEGEGGMIGIELVGSRSRITFDFNCGGMFRAWIDDFGEPRFMAFRED